MKAVIMVAGQSTRTYPLTSTRPKPLLKVLNKPILAWQLDGLGEIIDEAILVVGYRQEMIREAFGEEYRGIKISYVEQKEQLGTGHAVLTCEKHVGDEPFIAMNGDDLYAPEDIHKLADKTNAALAKPVDDPSLYGVYEVDENDVLVRLVEKPAEPASDLANTGVYVFTPDVFDVLRNTKPSERGEIEVTCAIQTLADRGPFEVVRMEGYWLPVGYPWHLLEANEYLIKRIPHFIDGDVSERADMNGEVQVGRGTVVRSGVVIDGPVYIGENCVVGPNAWLRPGTVLCDGCKIGQATEIKNSVIMDGACVPHLSYVGDSIVGENVNLGAGTITANLRHDGANIKSMVRGELVDTGRRKLGAIIADNVHTGIRTAIYPGRKLWPNASTAPGEVVKADIQE